MKMKWFGRRSKCEGSEREAIENVLAFAEAIIERNMEPKERLIKLIDLRRVFLRKFQADHIAACYCSGTHQAPEPIEVKSLLCQEMLLEENQVKKISEKISLDLAQDVVLPTPWHPKRMIDNIGKFGSDPLKTQWVQDTNNHFVYWMSTFGIGIVDGGNHSLTAAIIANEQIKFTLKHQYDYSFLFESYHFNGSVYVDSKTGRHLSAPRFLVFGVIYELSRLINL